LRKWRLRSLPNGKVVFCTGHDISSDVGKMIVMKPLDLKPRPQK
jgi:hypothetical protein